MIFTNRNIDIRNTLKIDNESIECVTSTKFLGVIIDEQLSWKDHISMVKKKRLVEVLALFVRQEKD